MTDAHGQHGSTWKNTDKTEYYSCFFLLATDEVSAGFAAADQLGLASLNQNFRGAWARIVVEIVNTVPYACRSAPQHQHILLRQSFPSGQSWRAKQSPDSQTGPTMSARVRAPETRWARVIGCVASYSAGRMKSFIAASTITKFLPRFRLLYKTRISNTPALPINDLPGSINMWQPSGRTMRASSAAQAACSGGFSEV